MEEQCTNCGLVLLRAGIPAIGHTWDAGKTDKEPTCTEPGHKISTCTICKETTEYTIPAKGHSENEGVITTPVTCGTNGVKTISCKVCTMEIRTEVILATGKHLYQSDQKCHFCDFVNDYITEELEYFLEPETDTYIVKESKKYNGLTQVVIPSYHEGKEITGILQYAFKDNTTITDIIIPDTVNTFYMSAFYNCTNLKRVIIPSDIKVLPANTFYGCSSLTDITLPEGLAVIREAAFENCSALTEIEIPNSVNHIDEYAFSNCTNLEKINIPEDFTAIRSEIFKGCTKLTNVNYEGSISQWEAKIADTSSLNPNWSNGSSIERVTCSDGIWEMPTAAQTT